MLKPIGVIGSFFIMAVLVLGDSLLPDQPYATADDETGIVLQPYELPEKGNPKLDTQLNELVAIKTPEKAPSYAQKYDMGLDEGYVRVIVECIPGQVDTAIEAAITLGADVETGRLDLFQITVPLSSLTTLAESPAVSFVHLPIYTETYETSQGVALINADDWHTAGYTGSGVKIGVLDGGFYGYEDLLGTDLPASVTTQCFLFGGDIHGPTGYPIEHGTGCAEIVYDIAPDAQFYLVNYGNNLEILDAIDYLIYEAEVDIITHSCGNPIWGPGDGSGAVCDKIAEARAEGILWSQAMGNSAQAHWWGNWDDTNTNDYLDFIPGTIELVPVYLSPSTSLSAYLKWDDPWGTSSNDYDLILFDDTLTLPPVGWSHDIQDGLGGNDYPIEYIPYSATYEGWHYIAVGKADATGPETFHLFTYPCDFGDTDLRVPSRSLSVPADSLAAVSVGAVYWDTPTILEDFSSRGPNDNGDIKPDLVAPDGVSSVTYPDFYGTSAAAPHAAGAAVLVKQRYPTYTPIQIQAFLEGRAVEIGGDGKDNIYGSGRLDLGLPPPLTSPIVVTDNATGITTGSATLNGNLSSLGEYSSANVSFEWGTISGALDHVTANQTMALTGVFSANLNSLTPSTTYYFRAKAISDGVTVYGSERSLTTLKLLSSIAVTPDSPSISAGWTQPFTATGTYSDSSTDNITSSVTWSSSNNTVAIIFGNGLALSFAEGTSIITATLNNISGNTTLTVGPPVFVSFEVTPHDASIVFHPESPYVHQFDALAHYSAGPAVNVNTLASWTSDNTSVATVDASGLATAVAAGTAVISATYNSTTANATLTVLPDTVAPVVKLTNPAEGQVFSDDNTTVYGVIDDSLASANVTVNGNQFLLSNNSGTFSKSVTLCAGSNTILVKAVDGTGNIGTSGTLTVVYDPNKPGVFITQPAAGTVTNNANMAVTGTVTGNVTSVNLILNGVSRTSAVTGGNFSANVTLAEGMNILVANAYTGGHAGDSRYLGTSGVRMVRLDKTPPVITITTPAPGSLWSIMPWPGVWGWLDDLLVNTANVTLNNTSFLLPVVNGVFGWDFGSSSALVSGNNTLTITATDELGNLGSTSLTIIYDSTYTWPQIEIFSPANKQVTNNINQAVTGIVYDPTITAATLYVNGAPRTISVVPGGKWGSFSENITLVSGANTLEVRASNNATPSKIATSGVFNVMLDNTAPRITIGMNDPTDSITITVSSDEALTAAPSVSVNSTIITMMPTIDINHLWSAAYGGTNTWSGTCGSIGSPLTEGAYTVTANATDKAGNTMSKTATFCKETVTISENETATVSTSAVTLQISTTANVTNALVSVTHHQYNPSGNIGHPSGTEKVAGVFIEIVTSPELRDNLEQIYIQADYDPNALPADTNQSKLKLYLWDVSSGIWQVVPGSGVNTQEHYIYGTVTHLSIYGGFGTAIVTPPPRPSGGGGGGGGSSGTTNLVEYMTGEGKFISDATAESPDGLVKILIPKDTIAKNRTGARLRYVSIKNQSAPSDLPAECEYVCLTYDIGPNGSTFAPLAYLIFKYKDTEVPEGVAEDNLVIATWQDETWVELEGCVVDTAKNTITAPVNHFSIFTAMAHTSPASIGVAGMTVTPAEVRPDAPITISVTVTNSGDLTDSYTVVLKINNSAVQDKLVTLKGGESQTISFKVTQGTAGEYTVTVGGLSGKFTVKEPVPESTVAEVSVPTPASFTVSDFLVTPGKVNPSEEVTVSAVVKNTGGSDGSYTVVLKIDDIEEARKEVIIRAGKSEIVSFIIARDRQGSYTVNIDGNVGRFTVAEKIIPSAPVKTSPVESKPTREYNLGLIIGIVAGSIVFIALLLYFTWWRKRGVLK